MVGAVRGRKFGRWVSKIGVERATDRRVKRSGEAGLLPPAPSPLYPNALCSPAPSPLYPNALRSPAPSPLCPNVLRPPRHRPFVQMRFAPPRHRRFIQMRFAPPHHRRFIQMRFAPPRHRPLYPSALRSVEAGANEDLPSSSLTSRGYRSANHWSWAGIRGGSCAYQFLEWITFRRWACCLLTPTGPGEGPWNSWISRSPRTVGTSVRPRYYSRGQGERRRLSRWLPSHTRQRESRSP